MFLSKLRSIIENFRNRLRKTRMRFVHEEDLIPLLNSIGITEQIEKGDYRCLYCNRVITMENLWAITKKDEKFCIVCSETDCLNNLY